MEDEVEICLLNEMDLLESNSVSTGILSSWNSNREKQRSFGLKITLAPEKGKNHSSGPPLQPQKARQTRKKQPEPKNLPKET